MLFEKFRKIKKYLLNFSFSDFQHYCKIIFLVFVVTLITAMVLVASYIAVGYFFFFLKIEVSEQLKILTPFVSALLTDTIVVSSYGMIITTIVEIIGTFLYFLKNLITKIINKYKKSK